MVEGPNKSTFDPGRLRSQVVNITILGDPSIIAVSMLNLTGFNPVMNQQWWISKVEHEFTKGGFISVISAMLPSTTGTKAGKKELRGFAADV